MDRSPAILLVAALTFVGISVVCFAYDEKGIALNRRPGDAFVLEIDRAAYDRMNCTSVSDCAPLRALIDDKLKREKPCAEQYVLSPPNTENRDQVRFFGSCVSLSTTARDKRQSQSSAPEPRAVYTTIDTRPALDMIKRLTTGSEQDRKAAVSEVLNQPSQQMPPVLYALANALSRETGRMDEAIFWYHVGRVRAVYDAYRCEDESARQAVSALGMGLTEKLRKAQIENPERVVPIAKKAIEWDAANPHAYDHRWINLHGLRALDPSVTQGPLSAPESEWPSLLTKVHSEHLQNVESFAAARKRK